MLVEPFSSNGSKRVEFDPAQLKTEEGKSGIWSSTWKG